MLVAALITVAVAALGATNAAGNCKLNLQTQLNKLKEPLILEDIKNRDQQGDTLAIIRPQVEVINGETQGVIHVDDGKALLIACPDKDNAVEGSPGQTASVKCSAGQLTINDLPANEDTLSCTNGVANSWVVSTGQKCGKGDYKGTIFELGFKLSDEQPSFFPLVEVCYNSDKMVTYYTTHELYGASLKGAVKSDKRRNFSPGPAKLKLFRGLSPDKAYKQEQQKKVFDEILGKGTTYLKELVFMARGHLSPDADFLYLSGQLMTYYFINAAPQWQTFNAGNWLKVENTVRDLASKKNATLTVWTGTYGVLKLMDVEGNEKEIYLDPKESSESSNPKESHLPVPEVFWKLVQHPTSKSCTVAVGHNNVFFDNVDQITPICKNHMEHIDGWQELKDLSKGYGYYCDYESFKKTVSYVPDIQCTDLFPRTAKNIRQLQKIRKLRTNKKI